MKSTSVETVTNNEDYVRLRIYDGEIPMDQAGAELLRLNALQRVRDNDRVKRMMAMTRRLAAQNRRLRRK
jgi:hypothetical protein